MKEQRKNELALIKACKEREVSIDYVKLLLKAEVDVNTKDRNGVTALMCACATEKEDLVRILIEARADVNAKDKWEDTALMRACVNKNSSIIRLLIKAGINVNAANDYGWTALMYASRDNYKNSIILLIEAGADVDAENGHGTTALMMAEEEGHTEVIKLLKKYTMKGRKQRYQFVMNDIIDDKDIFVMDKSALIALVKNSSDIVSIPVARIRIENRKYDKVLNIYARELEYLLNEIKNNSVTIGWTKEEIFIVVRGSFVRLPGSIKNV